MIEVGDHVVVGSSGRVHWIVLSIDPPNQKFRRACWIRSGLTGRRREEWVDRLTLHSKGKRQMTTHEHLANMEVRAEMIAEGIVKRDGETLVYRRGNRVFMIETRAFEIDLQDVSRQTDREGDKMVAKRPPVMLTTPAAPAETVLEEKVGDEVEPLTDDEGDE